MRQLFQLVKQRRVRRRGIHVKTALILRIAIALSRQIELDFRGNHREEAVLVEAGHDVLQYRARLKRAGVTVAVFHRQQDLRGVIRILRTGA